jgi:hypothetical protein
MTTNSLPGSDRKEIAQNARVGYQVAANLAANEQAAAWARYYAMLTANGIFAASALLSLAHQMKVISIAIPVAGLAVCFCWFCSMERRYTFYDHWMASARELERNYLSPAKTIASGELLSKGKQIPVPDHPENKPLKMGPFQRIRMKWYHRAIIGCFFAIFAILLAYAICLPNQTEEKNEQIPETSARSPTTPQLATQILPAAAAIVGVFIGYFLTSFSRWRENRKKLNNMRSILVKEMGENYSTLVSAIPNDKYPAPLSERVGMPAIALRTLSSDVYDTHLESLRDLTQDEAEKIYDAYVWIKKSAPQVITQYDQAFSNQTPNEATQRMLDKALSTVLEGTLQSLSKAILLFKDGREILKQADDKKGSSYRPVE